MSELPSHNDIGSGHNTPPSRLTTPSSRAVPPSTTTTTTTTTADDNQCVAVPTPKTVLFRLPPNSPHSTTHQSSIPNFHTQLPQQQQQQQHYSSLSHLSASTGLPFSSTHVALPRPSGRGVTVRSSSSSSSTHYNASNSPRHAATTANTPTSSTPHHFALPHSISSTHSNHLVGDTSDDSSDNLIGDHDDIDSQSSISDSSRHRQPLNHSNHLQQRSSPQHRSTLQHPSCQPLHHAQPSPHPYPSGLTDQTLSTFPSEMTTTSLSSRQRTVSGPFPGAAEIGSNSASCLSLNSPPPHHLSPAELSSTQHVPGSAHKRRRIPSAHNNFASPRPNSISPVNVPFDTELDTQSIVTLGCVSSQSITPTAAGMPAFGSNHDVVDQQQQQQQQPQQQQQLPGDFIPMSIHQPDDEQLDDDDHIGMPSALRRSSRHYSQAPIFGTCSHSNSRHSVSISNSSEHEDDEQQSHHHHQQQQQQQQPYSQHTHHHHILPVAAAPPIDVFPPNHDSATETSSPSRPALSQRAVSSIHVHSSPISTKSQLLDTNKLSIATATATATASASATAATAAASQPQHSSTSPIVLVSIPAHPDLDNDTMRLSTNSTVTTISPPCLVDFSHIDTNEHTFISNDPTTTATATPSGGEDDYSVANSHNRALRTLSQAPTTTQLPQISSSSRAFVTSHAQLSPSAALSSSSSSSSSSSLSTLPTGYPITSLPTSSSTVSDQIHSHFDTSQNNIFVQQHQQIASQEEYTTGELSSLSLCTLPSPSVPSDILAAAAAAASEAATDANSMSNSTTSHTHACNPSFHTKMPSQSPLISFIADSAVVAAPTTTTTAGQSFSESIDMGNADTVNNSRSGSPHTPLSSSIPSTPLSETPLLLPQFISRHTSTPGSELFFDGSQFHPLVSTPLPPNIAPLSTPLPPPHPHILTTSNLPQQKQQQQHHQPFISIPTSIETSTIASTQQHQPLPHPSRPTLPRPLPESAAHSNSHTNNNNNTPYPVSSFPLTMNRIAAAPTSSAGSINNSVHSPGLVPVAPPAPCCAALSNDPPTILPIRRLTRHGTLVQEVVTLNTSGVINVTVPFSKPTPCQEPSVLSRLVTACLLPWRTPHRPSFEEPNAGLSVVDQLGRVVRNSQSQLHAMNTPQHSLLYPSGTAAQSSAELNQLLRTQDDSAINTAYQAGYLAGIRWAQEQQRQKQLEQDAALAAIKAEAAAAVAAAAAATKHPGANPAHRIAVVSSPSTSAQLVDPFVDAFEHHNDDTFSTVWQTNANRPSLFHGGSSLILEPSSSSSSVSRHATPPQHTPSSSSSSTVAAVAALRNRNFAHRGGVDVKDGQIDTRDDDMLLHEEIESNSVTAAAGTTMATTATTTTTNMVTPSRSRFPSISHRVLSESSAIQGNGSIDVGGGGSPVPNHQTPSNPGQSSNTNSSNNHEQQQAGASEPIGPDISHLSRITSQVILPPSITSFDDHHRHHHHHIPRPSPPAPQQHQQQPQPQPQQSHHNSSIVPSSHPTQPFFQQEETGANVLLIVTSQQNCSTALFLVNELKLETPDLVRLSRLHTYVGFPYRNFDAEDISWLDLFLQTQCQKIDLVHWNSAVPVNLLLPYLNVLRGKDRSTPLHQNTTQLAIPEQYCQRPTIPTIQYQPTSSADPQYQHDILPTFISSHMNRDDEPPSWTEDIGDGSNKIFNIPSLKQNISLVLIIPHP